MSMNTPRRVAIFGGAFDPPHYAHLFAIQTLLLRDDIDEIWLVPTYKHVFNKQMTAFDERCYWLEQCVQASDWSNTVSVHRIEQEMGGDSRTYDTLERLSDTYTDTQFCFVIGADNLAMSHRWHRFDELVARWPLIVFGRPGFEKVMQRYQNEPWCHAALTLPAVSSSMIRAGVQRDAADILQMIPEPIRAGVQARFKTVQPTSISAALSVRIIGLGRVGQSLQHTLAEFGVPTLGWSRSEEDLTEHLRANPLETNQLILVTVSDPAIEAIVGHLVPFLDGSQVLLHCAGARGPVVMEGLDPNLSGVLHPIRAIPDGHTSLTHQVWGISGGDSAQIRARELIALFEGEHVAVPDDKAVIYHAAMVVAGNFPLALQAVSESIMGTFASDASVARKALQTLHLGALNNIVDTPIHDALTGPVARKDLATIQAHVAALEAANPELAVWYRKTTRLLAGQIGWQEGIDAFGDD